MNKLLALVASLAVAGILAVPAFGASKTVKVGDNFFVRASGVPTVTVKKGTTVVWKLTGNVAHNVTVTKGPKKFHSSTLTPGRSYRHKVTARGTYTIVCTFHPGMEMKLKVK